MRQLKSRRMDLTKFFGILMKDKGLGDKFRSLDYNSTHLFRIATNKQLKRFMYQVAHEIYSELDDLFLFELFMVDLAFTEIDDNYKKYFSDLLTTVNNQEQEMFLERFKLTMESIKLKEKLSKDIIIDYVKEDDYDTKYLEGVNRLKWLLRWIDNELEMVHLRSNVTDSISLFRWEGEQTKLAELILFLSATGWIKINPDLKHTKSFLERLAKVFAVYDQDQKKYVPLNLSSFQKYFTSLKLDNINEIEVDEIYQIDNDKFHPTKETVSFKGIKPRSFS